MKRFAYFAALALLAACAPDKPSPPPESPLHVSTGISQSTGDTYLYSPMNVMPPSKALPIRVMWQLNTQITHEDREVAHSLRISVAYAAAKHKRYVSVVDDTGGILPFTQVGKVGKPCPGKTCLQKDTLDVTLADDDLRAHAKDGWTLKLVTKTKEAIPVTLSPDILALQLAETDKAVRAGSPAK